MERIREIGGRPAHPAPKRHTGPASPHRDDLPCLLARGQAALIYERGDDEHEPARWAAVGLDWAERRAERRKVQ